MIYCVVANQDFLMCNTEKF